MLLKNQPSAILTLSVIVVFLAAAVNPQEEIQHLGRVEKINIPAPNLFPESSFPWRYNNAAETISATLYLPNDFENLMESGYSFPLLVYLHGGWDGHNQNAISYDYERRDCFHGEDILDYMIDQEVVPPMIAVAPFADDPRKWENGWWGFYENFILYDLIPYFIEHYHVDQNNVAVNGLCDGGMAALKIAMRHPNVFIWAGCTSGAYPIKKWTPDIVAFNQKLTVQNHRLQGLYFTCGVEDKFIDYNRNLNQYLTALSIPHIYREIPCGHDFDTWGEDFFAFIKNAFAVQ